MEHYKLNIRNITADTINVNISLENPIEFDKSNNNKEIISDEISKKLRPSNSRELIRFRVETPYSLKFNFDGVNNYSQLGFSTTDLLIKSPIYDNSYYIIDYYTSTDLNTQTLLYTSFHKPLTTLKDSNGNVTGARMNTDIDFDELESSFLYIPEYLLPQISNTIYVKYRFFNAKDGKIYDFTRNENIENETVNYGLIKLNKNDYTYNFESIKEFNSFINNFDTTSNNNFSTKVLLNNAGDSNQHITLSGNYS